MDGFKKIQSGRSGKIRVSVQLKLSDNRIKVKLGLGLILGSGEIIYGIKLRLDEITFEVK